MTLVVLAAGMASRYGGLKQIDPVTSTGEFIIDFSIYDAYRAGFDKVVFVIKKENLEAFKSTIGVRAERFLKVDYAFQALEDIPERFSSLLEGRVKPWGTAHAVLAARSLVNENFAVINADDFYGKDAFEKLASHLSAATSDGRSHFCMVGYVLKNTLTENGSVSRGVCRVDDNGMLIDVTERSKIFKTDGGAEYEEKGVRTPVSENSIVSMNCWGFTPDVFDGIAEGFERFLESHPGEKTEYYLPYAVSEIKSADKADVRVYDTNERWYGVTYKQDKQNVVDGIGELIKSGVYNVPLWK